MKALKNEKQLQAACVRKFREIWPERRKLLWSTPNRSLSRLDGMTQIATGMVAGVSDLIYFKDGVLTCIELKFPGERHKLSHLKNQLAWGLEIEKEGGRYFICTTTEDFILLINGNLDLCMNVDQLSKIVYSLLTENKKTITF